MKAKLLLFIGIFFIGISNPICAQDLGDGPEPPPTAPINQYVPLLIVAGFVFGLKKIAKQNNRFN